MWRFGGAVYSLGRAQNRPQNGMQVPNLLTLQTPETQHWLRPHDIPSMISDEWTHMPVLLLQRSFVHTLESLQAFLAPATHVLSAHLSRHDRASELLDEWDCVDELVDEESWSQELVV